MISKTHAPVVVGVDGSDEAMAAADYGAAEAARRRVPLRLVYARQPTPLWGPSSLVLDQYSWERDWVQGLLTKTHSEIAAEHPDLEIHTTVVSGGPAGVLVAESAEASLVVVGTRATTGLIGHLSGSVAAQVAAHATSPVVVVRGATGQGPDGRFDPATWTGRPVVVGVDGSAGATRAIDYAVREAVARGAELHAVLVWSLFELHDVGPIVPDDFDEAHEHEKAERLLDEALAGWADPYPDLRIVRHAVHDLDPVKVILDETENAGLVVVGSRGHGGFLGLLLGSTVDGLIRQARVPVAIVHGDSDDPPPPTV